MRKVIARRMVESKQQVPHFYLSIDCELDQLLKLTERYCVVYQTIKNGLPIEITMRRV